MGAGRGPRAQLEPDPGRRGGLPPEPGRPLAVGWATVDLDRAASELGELLHPGSAFEPADDSFHLGARCRLGRVDPMRVGEANGAGWIVLLEPATEGRLAATLARHDEGWCARWTEVGAPPGEADPAAPSGDHPLSAARAGPLGPERLVLGGPIDGPHRLLVVPATIER